jgi:hypothetical protein
VLCDGSLAVVGPHRRERITQGSHSKKSRPKIGTKIALKILVVVHLRRPRYRRICEVSHMLGVGPAGQNNEKAIIEVKMLCLFFNEQRQNLSSTRVKLLVLSSDGLE